MEFEIELVALVTMLAVFMLIIAFFTFRHAISPRNQRAKDTWLFEGWQENIYNALFKQDARVIAKKVGVDVNKYLRNCQLNHDTPALKKVVVDRIFGFMLLGIGILFTVIAKNPVWFVAGVATSVFPMFLPAKSVEKAAQKRRFQLADELPRFLDLLYTALMIGMPIEQAIEVTATHLQGSVLADEMLRTIADAKVGANNWQTALAQLAEDYEVDPLSDFVLDITNAYNNGSPIIDAVVRQSKDIKQTNLVTMKERASRLTSTILFPILFFKIMPILLLMCVPIIVQLTSSGFGF